MDSGAMDSGAMDGGPPVRIEIVAPDGTLDTAGFAIEHRLGEPDEAGIRRLEVTVRHAGRQEVERGVRVVVELRTAGEPPRWLIPGLFYGTNRPEGCRLTFPAYRRDADSPEGMESERWAFRSDRAATPAVIGWSGGRMVGLATDPETPIGPAGIGFIGCGDRTEIWADLPWREEPVAYRGDERADPPEALSHRWAPGEEVTLELELVVGGADPHGYVPFLRHRWARTRGRPAPWVDVETAAELAADGLLRWHYHPEHRALYETAAFERNLDGSSGGEGDRPHMHVGWVSGAPWAAQLLAWGRRIGSEEHVRAGVDTLDFIAENLSPSGTFWAAWRSDRGWGTGWSPSGTIHANTVGQATLFFLRALAAEDRAGATHAQWDAAVRSNLDAICARQRDDGNLGTYHDARTGAVTEWDGAGALVWIAALLEGAARYAQPRYATAAERAGSFYRRFVDAELIYGAPEDVHLTPTSEDGYNAVLAYTALHGATGEGHWLDVARRAADWALTWRYTYDVAFHPHTILAEYAFRTTGTDQASPANQHLHHFGLICNPELVELSRLTGDDHYRLRAAEALGAWRQFIARHDGDFNAMRGMVAERFFQTDYHRPKGGLMPLSHAWTGGVLLFACLAALEDPEAYALPD